MLDVEKEFMPILKTLPDESPVPLPIVKLGLLTGHIEPVRSKYEVQFSDDDLSSASTATVPPETLAEIKYLVSHHTDHLSGQRKKQIGKLCSASKLDIANKLGASIPAVKQAISQVEGGDYSFFIQTEYRCEYCGKVYDTVHERNGHLANCNQNPDVERISSSPSNSGESTSNSQPAYGKEIRKDRGSERVSGRNPFADPERVKDTGLHQGGGD